MKLNDFINLVNQNLNAIESDNDFYNLYCKLKSLIYKLSDGALTISAPDNKCTYGYLVSVMYDEIIASFDIKKKKLYTKNYSIYSETFYTVKAVILSKDENGDAEIKDLLQDAKRQRDKLNNAKRAHENALIDFLKTYDFSNVNSLQDVYTFKKTLLDNYGDIYRRLNSFMFND